MFMSYLHRNSSPSPENSFILTTVSDNNLKHWFSHRTEPVQYRMRLKPLSSFLVQVFYLPPPHIFTPVYLLIFAAPYDNNLSAINTITTGRRAWNSERITIEYSCQVNSRGKQSHAFPQKTIKMNWIELKTSYFFKISLTYLLKLKKYK